MRFLAHLVNFSRLVPEFHIFSKQSTPGRGFWGSMWECGGCGAIRNGSDVGRETRDEPPRLMSHVSRPGLPSPVSRPSLPSLVSRQTLPAATRFTISATASHFIRIEGFFANRAGSFPLCFAKNMNVSAKSSCVAVASLLRTTCRLCSFRLCRFCCPNDANFAGNPVNFAVSEQSAPPAAC